MVYWYGVQIWDGNNKHREEISKKKTTTINGHNLGIKTKVQTQTTKVSWGFQSKGHNLDTKRKKQQYTESDTDSNQVSRGLQTKGHNLDIKTTVHREWHRQYPSQ